MNKIRLLFKDAGHETRNNNFDKAIGFYKEIIKLSKDDVRIKHIANWGIGEIYLNNKQYDQAEIYLKRAIELDPEESSYHYLLGCTYTYTNEIGKALRQLEKAVELDDSKDIYWNQLGWVLGYNRDVNKGIECLKKSLKLNPDNYKSLKDICMLYAKSERWGEAIICIEEAISKNPHREELIEIKEDLEFFKKEFIRLSKEK